MEILQNNIVLLALTFGIFFLARQLQKRVGWIVLNPLLVTIAALIVLLKVTGISYAVSFCPSSCHNWQAA